MERPRNLADLPRSYAGLESEARLFREFLGIDLVDPLPSVGLFEGLRRLRIPGSSVPVDYGVEPLALGVEAESRYVPEAGLIEVVLDEHTYEQLEQEDYRARFCLAHELGHVFLHAAELIRLSRMPGVPAGLARGNAHDVPAYLDVEWQANAFASAILMPAPALAEIDALGKLCIREIQERFNVSKACARIRLEVFARKREQLLTSLDSQR